VHLTSQRPEGEKTEMESDLVLHRSLTAADGSPGINIFVKRGRDSPSGQLAVLPPRDLPSSPPRHLDPQRSRKTSSSRTVTPPRSDHGMHHHAQAAEPVAAPAAAAPPSTSPDRPSTPPPSSVQPLELEEGGANTVGSPDVLTPQSVDVGLVERTSARARAISMSRTPRSDSDGAAASRQPVILNQRTEQGRKFRCAAWKGDLNLVMELIQAGVDVNEASVQNRSALSIASERGHLHCTSAGHGRMGIILAVHQMATSVLAAVFARQNVLLSSVVMLLTCHRPAGVCRYPADH
jgi:hypothetical protein